MKKKWSKNLQIKKKCLPLHQQLGQKGVLIQSSFKFNFNNIKEL